VQRAIQVQERGSGRKLPRGARLGHSQFRSTKKRGNHTRSGPSTAVCQPRRVQVGNGGSLRESRPNSKFGDEARGRGENESGGQKIDQELCVPGGRKAGGGRMVMEAKATKRFGKDQVSFQMGVRGNPFPG